MIKKMIYKIKYILELIHFKRYWRRVNSHNYTTVGNVFPYNKVTVGNKTYGQLNIKTYGNDKEYLKIGSYCSIAGDVKFLLGGEHEYKCLSTYPFRKYFDKKKENTLSKGPITINDDVWIGENTIILSGIEIGQGAVIAAGSIVAKNVPPYAVYIGNGVRKYRFSDEIIEKLLKFDFSRLSDELIVKNMDLMYRELDESNIDNFINNLINIMENSDNE